jgi:PAS domain S-box-containing protein
MPKKLTRIEPGLKVKGPGQKSQKPTWTGRSSGQRKARSQSYLDTLEAIIIALNSDGRITYINQKGCKLLGRRMDDLMGQAWFSTSLPQPEDMKNICPCFLPLTTSETEPGKYSEDTHITKSGDVHQVIWDNMFLRENPEQVIGSIDTGEDITGHKSAEDALGADEENFRSLFNAINESICIFDLNGIARSVNNKFASRLDYSPQECIGAPMYSLMSKKEAASRKPYIDKVIRTGQSTIFEDHQKGRWFRNNIFPISNKEGVVDRYAIYEQDITERKQDAATLQEALDTIEVRVEKRTAAMQKTNVRLKQEVEERKRAEQALAEQKDFLNTLLETISNPVFYKDADGRYLGCNRAFEDFTGKPRSDIIRKTVYEMGPRKIAEKYHQKDMELFTTPGKQHYEWKLKRNDGVLRDVIFDKATLLDNSGSITGLVGIISDITERKQAEDLVHDLSQMLIKAQENERQMISYELHDSIAQSLSSLKIICDTFFDDHSATSHELKEKMAKQSKLIGQVINSVRNLSYGLHPPDLDQRGIIQALSQLCDDFSEQTGLTIEFKTAGMQSLKPYEMLAINLYRLVQEGLNNIRKHADAHHVTVNLVAAHPNLILRIEDDGKGLDLKKYQDVRVRKKKMGLRSMKERVNLLQGSMQIHSIPKKGTKISIKIPFIKNKRNDESENTNNHY